MQKKSVQNNFRYQKAWMTPGFIARILKKNYGGCEMEIEKYIEITKNKPGLKLSVCGMIATCSTKKGRLSKSDQSGLEEISRLYYLGREAWLNGDLETVAQMFGILV